MEKPRGYEGLSGRDDQTGRRGWSQTWPRAAHAPARGGFGRERNSPVWARGLPKVGDFSFGG